MKKGEDAVLLTKSKNSNRAPQGGAQPYGVAPLDGRPSPAFYPPPMAHPASPRRNAPSKGGIPAPAIILIVILGGVLFYFSADRGFLLGQIAAAVAVPLALHGLWRGAFRKTFMLAVFLGLFWFAGPLSEGVEQALAALNVNPGPLTKLAFFGSSGLVILTAHFFSKAIRTRYIARRRSTLLLDQLGGVSVGLAEGALVVLTLCWMSTSLEEFGGTLAENGKAEKSAFRAAFGNTILRMARETRSSSVAEFVNDTNPVRKTPELASMVDSLNQTGSLDLGNLNLEGSGPLQSLLDQLPGLGAGGLQEKIKDFEQAGAARAKAYEELKRRKVR